MRPIDLRAEFGDKWRIELDESAKGRWADPWNYVVPCRHGHLYPVGGDFLGAATNRSGAIVRKLREIEGVELVADGEDGANVTFHRARLRFIQRVMRPRSVRRLSPAQRAALAQGRLRKNPLE
jgi:hypothetical protein